VLWLGGDWERGGYICRALVSLVVIGGLRGSRGLSYMIDVLTGAEVGELWLSFRVLGCGGVSGGGGVGGFPLVGLSFSFGVEIIVDAPQLNSSSVVSIVGATALFGCLFSMVGSLACVIFDIRAASARTGPFFRGLGEGELSEAGEVVLMLGGRRMGVSRSQSDIVRLRLGGFCVCGDGEVGSLIVAVFFLPSGYPFLAISPGVARGVWRGGGVGLFVLSVLCGREAAGCVGARARFVDVAVRCWLLLCHSTACWF
jgi:hypothetical protein